MATKTTTSTAKKKKTVATEPVAEQTPFEPITKVGKYAAIVWDGGNQTVYTKDGKTLFAYIDKKGKARIGVKIDLTGIFDD